MLKVSRAQRRYSGDACSVLRGQPSGSDVRRLLVCAKLGLQQLFKYPCILSVFGYCIVCSFDCVLVLFVIKYFTKYTLCCRTHLTTLSHLLAVGGVTREIWQPQLHHHHHNGEGSQSVSGTLLIQTIPSLVLKLVFGKVNLNMSSGLPCQTQVLGPNMLCTNFSVASFNGFRNKQGVLNFFGCSPGPGLRQFWS